jgi:hypothetical protein
MLAVMSVVLSIAVALGGNETVYRLVWYSVRPLVVLAVVVGAGLLIAGTAHETVSPRRRLQIFLLLALAGLTSLVQFPYAFGIYFCYAAPLTILALLFVVSEQPRAPRRLHACAALFYLAFAVLWVNRGFIRDIGGRFTYLEQSTPLGVERAGLKVAAPVADLYRQLVAEIQSHSADGEFIYATPDCPEVYFLSARRNPTRTFYDFFDADYGTDFAARRRHVLELLERHNVNVVLFHWQPEFSRTFDPALFAALVDRYPHRRQIGMEDFPGPVRFTVRWRDSPARPAAAGREGASG